MCFGKRRIPKHLIIEDYQFHKRQTRGFLWICCAVVMLIGSMVFSIAAQASRGGASNHIEKIDDSKAGQLLFQNKYGLYDAALHLESKASVSISGMTAHVTLSQSFSNTSSEWQEGVYIFPLPENAAVNHMEMQIGERIIIGEIKEKQEAKRIYKAAKKAGKRAALTEQKRPNIFTQRVANIGPNESIKVSITYVQSIQYRDGEFNWNLPMTLTPRYVPGGQNTIHAQHTEEVKKNLIFEESGKYVFSKAQGWATSSIGFNEDKGENDSNPNDWPLPASLTSFHEIDIQNPISLNITLDSGLPLAELDSPHHEVQIVKSREGHHIELAQGVVSMDRDFILRWKASESATPQAAIFSEKIEGEYYSTVLMLPPQPKNKDESLVLPRDVIFIVDTSGSMAGASIEQAKRSLVKALSRLNTHDRFNIIEFSSRHTSIFQNLEPADDYNIEKAKRWAQNLRANGGTEMLPALKTALKQYEDSDALQQTIFITDGAVANEVQLFATIRNQLGNSRLFTVGIGSAPNSFFMKKAAEFGRGTFTFISQLSQVESKMDVLFDKLGSAVAKNISIRWPGSAEIYPQKIPDLYLNEPILIAAKSSDLKGDLEITGITADQVWRQYLSLDKHKESTGVSSIWAREKIDDLQDLKISGGNPDVIKQEITEIALRHKLLSPYTSFVAVEQKVVRPIEEKLKTSPMLNAMPAGHPTAKKPVQLPNTASTAQITWWIGLFFCFAWLISYRFYKD